MSPLGKLAFGAAGVAAVVVLFLVLRPDDSAETQPAAPATTATETAPTETGDGSGTATEPEPEPEREEPGPQVIRLDVRVDEPQIERFEVERGERVLLVVRADAVEHVHVHGYDLMAEVAPGQPGRIAFRATIPGRFEIELEDSHQQIAQLTVQP